MASTFGDKEESLIEIPRTNLLDVIEERNRTLSKKSLLHRMVIVAKISHANFADIGQHYERFLKDIQNHTNQEPVTGLLLLYPRHCVHVVEGPLEMLLEITRELRASSVKENSHVGASKILIVSHDLQARLYQNWSFRVLDIEPPQIENYEPNESAAAVTGDILVQLLKLGVYLSKQPKVALKSTMDSLHDKVPELLPQQDLIGFLINTDDRCINTPDEYLQKYEKPFDVVLDSEKSWPLPVRIFPYD